MPSLDHVWFQLGASAAAWIAPVTLRSLVGTSRVRVDDRGLLERARRGEAFIGAMWHEDIGFFGDFFRGTRFTVLASRSRDGEIAARIAHSLGLRTVRGSSWRGGEEALEQLIELARRGECVGFVADGPRGPAHVAKIGPVVAAKLSGRPIVPIACAMRGAIRLPSWDRTPPLTRGRELSQFRKRGIAPCHPTTTTAQGRRVAAIALERVAKHWGATRAVDDVSFDVEAGTFAVLLGPSGCGKSTTLRLIAGLETVTAGRVRIGGSDVTEAPPSKRNIAMVFQSYALFPHLSVAENILFGLKVRRVPAADRERRLKRVAELLGLDKLLARKPSQLSGGQQQRVALGRAIIAEHPVCLMDEPLSNLDAQLRHDMRREIRALQQKLGITMVYVTHDQTEAMSMADQVVLLREGRVEQDAAPAALYARPATAFAARFIGTPPMNLLRLADGARGAVIRGTDGAGRWRRGRARACCSASGRRRRRSIPPARRRRSSRWSTSAPTRSSPARSASEPFTVRAPGKLDLAGAAPGSGSSWPREAQHFFRAGRRPPRGTDPGCRSRGVTKRGGSDAVMKRIASRHSPRSPRPAWRPPRRRRPRSRSTTRWRWAGRSPRSSTGSPPISRRRTPASR